MTFATYVMQTAKVCKGILPVYMKEKNCSNVNHVNTLVPRSRPLTYMWMQSMAKISLVAQIVIENLPVKTWKISMKQIVRGLNCNTIITIETKYRIIEWIKSKKNLDLLPFKGSLLNLLKARWSKNYSSKKDLKRTTDIGVLKSNSNLW